ncbi:DUF2752 domain-containing protein [Patiriisocius sp. Uisw_047]|jgi:hypothetical protein|uniref:DUF2752 domain-containing protein n=1 Tax=Patiriisocius sp. Uisw_047 TaxID=3230969 RepID=UPI0039EA4F21
MLKNGIFLSCILLVFLGLGSIYFYFNPGDTSFFVPCPLRYVTGLECPGCGSQRAIHQLLHGNLKSAFGLNPFLILSIPLIGYGLGTKIYNYLFDGSHRVMLFYDKRFIYGYFGLAILFAIARNINAYPFTLLSSKN